MLSSTVGFVVYCGTAACFFGGLTLVLAVWGTVYAEGLVVPARRLNGVGLVCCSFDACCFMVHLGTSGFFLSATIVGFL